MGDSQWNYVKEIATHKKNGQKVETITQCTADVVLRYLEKHLESKRVHIKKVKFRKNILIKGIFENVNIKH